MKLSKSCENASKYAHGLQRLHTGMMYSLICCTSHASVSDIEKYPHSIIKLLGKKKKGGFKIFTFMSIISCISDEQTTHITTYLQRQPLENFK